MTISKTTVRPVRIHVPDADPFCDTSRGVGFRAVSADGWKGPQRKTYAQARQDARERNAHEQAARTGEAVSPAKGTEA